MPDDLVPSVPDPPKKKMTVEDWIAYFKEYFAQYDEGGRVLPLCIPTEYKKAIYGRDRINRKKNDRDLTDQQIEALEDIGFVFTGTRADKWEKNLEAFQEHKEVHGHLDITPDTAKQWPGLYGKACDYRHDWIAIQRGKKGRGKMNVDRIAQLEALGFNFNPTGMTFGAGGDAPADGDGKSSPSDDVDKPSASLVPAGGTNDPAAPRQTDPIATVAELLAYPDALGWFQIDPEGAARDMLGADASPVLVAMTTDLLRQGHPGIKFLLSSPTPRPREAAMILLEGALLHDTTMACAEAVLSLPGIQEFVSADPSNAALLFLSTNPSPPCLVEKVSNLLSSAFFRAILQRSTSSAASYLDKFIAKYAAEIPSGGEAVATSSCGGAHAMMDAVEVAATDPTARGAKSVSFDPAPESSLPSPSSPLDQPASKEEVRSIADMIREQRQDDQKQRQADREQRQADREQRQADQKHQLRMASMLNQHEK